MLLGVIIFLLLAVLWKLNSVLKNQATITKGLNKLGKISRSAQTYG